MPDFLTIVIVAVVCILDALAYGVVQRRYVDTAPHGKGCWSAGYIPRCREQWLARIPLGAIVMFFIYHPTYQPDSPK